jgi:thiosulfate dehydrogenase
MNPDRKFALVLLCSAAAIGAVLAVVFIPSLDFSATEAEIAAVMDGPDNGGAFPPPAQYLPPDIHDAPEEIRDAVLLGHKIMVETQAHLAAYVGNRMTCTSCHFNAGVTPGGKNGGVSLVGSAARYRGSGGGFRSADLTGRINHCLVTNMKGKELPMDSREMYALVTYLTWISRGIPMWAPIPWLEIEPAAPAHPMDVAAGKIVFSQQCAMCHGIEGQGTPIASPLWGDASFTAASSLARADRLAAFTLLNMPRENPSLTPEQARNVAGFLAAQARPAAVPGRGHPAAEVRSAP